MFKAGMVNESAVAFMRDMSREELEKVVRETAAQVFFGEHKRGSFPGYFAALQVVVDERAGWYRPGGCSVDYRPMKAQVDKIAAAL